MEFAFVTAGRGRHRTIHGDAPLRRGSVVVVRPGAWHAYQACAALAVTNCCFGAALLERELAWTREHPRLAPILLLNQVAHTHGVALHRVKPSALPRLVDDLSQLDSATRGGVADVRAAARLALLLASMAEALPAAAHAPARPAHPGVVAAIALLERRLQDDLTLDDLAAAASLDRAYLVRLFRAHTGLPPMRYLARLRLERAAALLLRTDSPVADVGQAVGLYDANYFARLFRAKFGVSASEYRARMRPSDRPE